MKKILLLTIGILLNLVSFAEISKDSTKIIHSKKNILHGGTYILLGLGTSSGVISGAQNGELRYGYQYNIEVGNQWLFIKKENWGLGMNVSWFTFGQSTYKSIVNDRTTKCLDLSLLRLGPLMSSKLNNNAAVDLYVNIAPSIKFTDYTETNFDRYEFGGMLGILGLKFRYKKYAFGIETQNANYVGRYKPRYDSPSPYNTCDLKMFNIRFVLGVKL